MAELGKFIHLHVHSEYSALDGANRIGDLAAAAKTMGMGAMALTDHGNLYGALQFQRACQAQGVKPILGCELYVAPGGHRDRTSNQARVRQHFIALAETNEGWENLSRLSSLGYLRGHYYKPRIDAELLSQYGKGLIGSSACIQGPVALAIRQDNLPQASREIDQYAQILGPGNFFLEIMDHGIPDEKKVNDAIIKLAKKHNLPIIATNDCHYLRAGDADAQDCLMCIAMGKMLADPKRMRYETHDLYVKTIEQMEAMFGHIEGALSNTVAIAERCNAEIPLKRKLLPKFKTPNGEEGEAFMRQLVEEGLARRYGSPIPGEVRERAEFELGVIVKMGFVDYFLVVQDFIRWAKDQKIPVGPGRGSGAGSIIAYALQITDLCPLENALLFERFLNPERVSMPDFDIDFCQARRGEVIEYVRRLYGEDCVSQIITFGKMKAKAAIRDVGRVMEVELSKVNQVAKAVPGDLKITIPRALGQDEEFKAKDPDRAGKMFSADLRELYDSDTEVHELIEMAKQVEGAIRQPGTHAAGVVICDRPLIDLIPLYRPAGDDNVMPATQFNMIEVEEMGLLKMDFLGLKNLTLIQHAVDSINERLGPEHFGGKPLAAEDIPREDPETYELLQAGKGLGVFQLESSGMRELLKNFKPARFSDVVALISLYRPGPMDNIPDFIARKEGRQKIEYEHPDLEPILRETYGLFVYQEQVMQVAQVLAGYSLGQADMLRRAMGKKKVEAMAKERVNFNKGCADRGINEDVATRVFDTMEKFASYGFNKSHAAAYSVVTIETAWLKRHYPVDFYAALIAMEVGGEDAKISSYFDEMREESIRIMPPEINTSGVRFTPVEGAVRFGLSAIKGVGEHAVESIIAERKRAGEFKSLQDFISRIDKRSVNSRTIECLVKAGAFDGFGHNRPSLLAVLPKLMEMAGMSREEENSDQISLFGMIDDSAAGDLKRDMPIPNVKDWPEKERLETEKELVGFYLTGHPLARYEPDFEAFSTVPAREFEEMKKGEEAEWTGLIKRVVHRTDKNGRQFAFAECEDSTGSLELTFFADVFMEARPLIREGEIIWVAGRVDEWRDTKKILVNHAKSIDTVREDRISALEITMPPGAVTEANLARVREIAAQHKGRRKLWLNIQNGAGGVCVEAGSGWGVKPSTGFVRELQDIDCIRSVRFRAKPMPPGYASRRPRRREEQQ